MLKMIPPAWSIRPSTGLTRTVISPFWKSSTFFATAAGN
jgi:hypothetical protein